LMYKYYWVKLFKIVPALERNENGWKEIHDTCGMAISLAITVLLFKNKEQAIS
jgi:hypothetical protein